MVIDRIYLKPEDYNNISLMFNDRIDHVIITKESYYILIIHGSKNGFVYYNGKLVSFEEVAKLLRKELNLTFDACLNVKVCCCYAQNQITYIDNNTLIMPMYYNSEELFASLNHNYCDFSYVN